jgi:hypothetical protein
MQRNKLAPPILARSVCEHRLRRSGVVAGSRLADRIQIELAGVGFRGGVLDESITHECFRGATSVLLVYKGGRITPSCKSG